MFLPSCLRVCVSVTYNNRLFDEAFLSFKHAPRLPLYKKMMHADYPNLYFIGLFQPLGCIWPLADLQARLAVREIRGLYQRPADMRRAVQSEVDHPHYNFQPSARHVSEVNYRRFRAELLRELQRTPRPPRRAMQQLGGEPR